MDRSDARGRPHTGGNFLVAIGDADPRDVAAGFCDVVFPVFGVGDSDGAHGAPRLTLRRGVTGHRDLCDWWDAVRHQQDDRRTVTVQLLAEDQHTVVMTWRFVDARPVSLAYSPLSAVAPEVVMETVELEYRRVEIA